MVPPGLAMIGVSAARLGRHRERHAATLLLGFPHGAQVAGEGADALYAAGEPLLRAGRGAGDDARGGTRGDLRPPPACRRSDARRARGRWGWSCSPNQRMPPIPSPRSRCRTGIEGKALTKALREREGVVIARRAGAAGGADHPHRPPRLRSRARDRGVHGRAGAPACGAGLSRASGEPRRGITCCRQPAILGDGSQRRSRGARFHAFRSKAIGVRRTLPARLQLSCCEPDTPPPK